MTTNEVDLEALRGFTPGPWTTFNVENSLGSVDNADGSIRVAQAMEVSISDRLSGHHMRKANARLIASAPDMHAELTARRARDAEVEALVAALHGLAIQWRHSAQGCSKHESHSAGTWRYCARDLDAILIPFAGAKS